VLSASTSPQQTTTVSLRLEECCELALVIWTADPCKDAIRHRVCLSLASPLSRSSALFNNGSRDFVPFWAGVSPEAVSTLFDDTGSSEIELLNPS
jgi:hypothetical protein